MDPKTYLAVHQRSPQQRADAEASAAAERVRAAREQVEAVRLQREALAREKQLPAAEEAGHPPKSALERVSQSAERERETARRQKARDDERLAGAAAVERELLRDTQQLFRSILPPIGSGFIGRSFLPRLLVASRGK
jgi:hypothetical protein